MVLSPGAGLNSRTRWSQTTEDRLELGARSGTAGLPGGRLRTNAAMEMKAEPLLGSHSSIIATLCDVAMAAWAVPAWFPDV